MSRLVEYFEGDDNPPRLSMNRLCTFIATAALTSTLIPAVFMKLEIAGTLATLLAGLGGFNYVAGRVTGAYTQVRMEQARQGIPAPDPAPIGPSTLIQVGQADKAKDVRKKK